MKNKVLIRVDGSSQLGLGHVTRCAALATMLAKNFVVEFYLCNSDPGVKDFLEQNGARPEILEHEQSFFEKINCNDIVVVDGYNFDNKYQRKIKELKAVLVCIDDLHDKHFVADIIINHAPGVSKEAYIAESYTKFLLGTKFTLLRPAFLRQATLSRRVENVAQVLICFGGADTKNLTISTLNVVLNDPRFSEIIVITGSAYNYVNAIDELVSKNEHVAHYHNIQDNEIIRLLQGVQLAIIPASGILFEVIACKTPAISGYYVNNQIDIYKGFLSLGVFYDAGDFGALKLKKAIGKAFTSDQNEMIEKQGNCIDGKSGERYLDFFSKLTYENSDSC